jgi:hypothetical protein
MQVLPFFVNIYRMKLLLHFSLLCTAKCKSNDFTLHSCDVVFLSCRTIGGVQYVMQFQNGSKYCQSNFHVYCNCSKSLFFLVDGKFEQFPSPTLWKSFTVQQILSISLRILLVSQYFFFLMQHRYNCFIPKKNRTHLNFRGIKKYLAGSFSASIDI